MTPLDLMKADAEACNAALRRAHIDWHDTPASAAKRARRKVIADLRRDGVSLRRIAARLGISVGAVQRDLANLRETGEL